MPPNVPHKSNTRPAAFLDRDGVINLDSGYVHQPEAIVWVEGVADAIKRLNDSGHYVFVVTNQAGVARGLYKESDVDALHQWMNAQLSSEGAHIDAFYFCPHHPEAGEPPYRQNCRCRKPEPGMLLRAFDEWPVDKASSFLVGDRETDLAAAAAAGIPAYLFEGGNLDHAIQRWRVPT